MPRPLHFFSLPSRFLIYCPPPVYMGNSMGRIFLFFVRRLRLPFLVFAGFGLLCVRVYMRLEHLRWQDALFWIVNPHSIDYRSVHDTTKFFALFVYSCVFAFQIWIAERILAT